MEKRFFNKLVTLLLPLLLLVSAIGLAEVKMYTGVGTCIIGDIGTPAQAKNMAREKALQNAKEQAGIYLTSYSRSNNTKLADNEISTITNNIINLVGEVEYQQTPGDVNGQPVITYTATLQANIDTDSIRNWLIRNEQEKNTIVKQNAIVKKEIENNLEQLENIAQQYNKAESANEKAQLKNEYNETDKKLLAAQKLQEGLRLFYKQDFDGAIRLYDEALAIYPYYAEAYESQGNAYTYKALTERRDSRDREIDCDIAIECYNNALFMNPKNAETYLNRGFVYSQKSDYESAIADFNQALAIDPGLINVYFQRGYAYSMHSDPGHAIADLRKYLEFCPDDDDAKILLKLAEQEQNDE